jgi:hypothetical protein
LYNAPEGERKKERHTRVTSADAHDDLTDVDTGDSAVGLAPRTTHTSLESIGTGARQHLVDADDVEGVGTDAEVETFLARVLDEVLVGADAGGLEGLGAQLLILVGDKVDAEGEVVDAGTLAAEIEDPDLGVGYTTVEAGLGERLRKGKYKSQSFCSVVDNSESIEVSKSIARASPTSRSDSLSPAVFLHSRRHR